MPRPKGSKNKKNRIETVVPVVAANEMEEQIALKNEVEEQIVVLENEMEAIKMQLKAKKSELKDIEKKIVYLEEKAAAEARAKAEAERQAAVSAVISELYSSGLTAEEILAKLKA